VFDIDYRPVLWGLTAPDLGENRFVADAAVTERLRQVAGLCDLIVGTEEEFQILGGETDTLAALRAVRRETAALLVCKRGPLGCVAFPAEIGDSLEGQIARTGLDIEVFNVLGAGDAFMAGFLRGWLRDEPLETCCDYANACGALVVSRHGCAPAMATWPELAHLLEHGSSQRRLRQDPELEHLHWATTRRPQFDELCVLAMDHRSQFLDLAAEIGADPARIGAFKALGLAAVRRVAGKDGRYGMLLDARVGLRALELAADEPYWIARPVEVQGSRPLAFEGGADVAATLREWPLRQVVKCLVIYHPEDDEDLRSRQERQLLRLFDACRATRHELLLEVIVSRSGAAVDASTVARAVERIYGLGVRPDWWKLEPAVDLAAWSAIARTIETRDPLCRGVLVLGQSARPEELAGAFRAAARFDIVKGFAVGRTIFEAPARQWLLGQIDDGQAIEALAGGFRGLIDIWRGARAEALARPAAE
jgi:5-dehydro-2-deoxygluconokinase